MAKLTEKIERVQKAGAPRLGFAPASATKKASMLLMVALPKADANLAAAAAQRGADSILVREPARTPVPQALKLNGQTPAGGAWKGTGEAASAGDFALIDADVPLGSLAGAEEIDIVLRLELDMAESELRTIEALPVDVLLLPGTEGAISMKTLVAYARFTRATSKPVLAEVEGDADAQALRALRDTGIAGFVVEVPDTAAVGAVEKLRKAIDSLPERKPRRGRAGAVATVGAAMGLASAMPARRPAAPDEDDDDEP